MRPASILTESRSLCLFASNVFSSRCVLRLLLDLIRRWGDRPELPLLDLSLLLLEHLVPEVSVFRTKRLEE
jgi:hypothetical protein